MANKKIEISTDLIPEGPVDHSQVKVKMTMWMDGDIILHARKRAKKEGKKYQQVLREMLRDSMTGGEVYSESVIKEVKELQLRMKRVEDSPIWHVVPGGRKKSRDQTIARTEGFGQARESRSFSQARSRRSAMMKKSKN